MEKKQAGYGEKEMENETTGSRNENGFRLNTEQQAEIGDILLSARAISRQMISQAREQSEEILLDAREKAEKIMREKEEKAEAALLDARAQAEKIVREAEEKAAAILLDAEQQIAKAPNTAQPSGAAAMPAEVQEYAVRCVGDCFAKLRQQQLESIDLINEQWRAFLSGLTLADETPPAVPLPEREVSREDIENRVNAIARELMDIIGK